MKAKTERNMEIVSKLRSGTTYRALSTEYSLAISTIQGIYNRWKYEQLKELTLKNANTV